MINHRNKSSLSFIACFAQIFISHSSIHLSSCPRLLNLGPLFNLQCLIGLSFKEMVAYLMIQTDQVQIATNLRSTELTFDG